MRRHYEEDSRGCDDKTRTQEQVCEIFNTKHPDRRISQSTVSRIENIFREFGNVTDIPKSGRKRILDDEQKLDILLDIQDNPHKPSRQVAADKDGVRKVPEQQNNSPGVHFWKKRFIQKVLGFLPGCPGDLEHDLQEVTEKDGFCCAQKRQFSDDTTPLVEKVVVSGSSLRERLTSNVDSLTVKENICKSPWPGEICVRPETRRSSPRLGNSGRGPERWQPYYWEVFRDDRVSALNRGIARASTPAWHPSQNSLTLAAIDVVGFSSMSHSHFWYCEHLSSPNSSSSRCRSDSASFRISSCTCSLRWWYLCWQHDSRYSSSTPQYSRSSLNASTHISSTRWSLPDERSLSMVSPVGRDFYVFLKHIELVLTVSKWRHKERDGEAIMMTIFESSVSASCVLQSLRRPSRVCGNRSRVLQSTSCFTPPTLMTTRRFSAFERIIMNGSGGSDDIDLRANIYTKGSGGGGGGGAGSWGSGGDICGTDE
ncbi:hypothetical protein NQ318_004772 [Aromia moschata]|uniref:DUF4817 domain-containing protein n=1 Tax=Aromia moschata TaxID=1265417 RepID=A0AAV8XS04_9CUCU|nr:hypothetical protein NQ318_004772 [Aromia moschata]